MGGTGLEPVTLALSKTAISQNPRAESGALDDKIGDSQQDLSWLSEHWANLPEHIKQQIMELIGNAVPEKERTL